MGVVVYKRLTERTLVVELLCILIVSSCGIALKFSKLPLGKTGKEYMGSPHFFLQLLLNVQLSQNKMFN